MSMDVNFSSSILLQLLVVRIALNQLCEDGGGFGQEDGLGRVANEAAFRAMLMSALSAARTLRSTHSE